jgi:hypothetical protein
MYVGSGNFYFMPYTAESVCMAGALYSSVLIEHANSTFTLLDSYPSYREYNFMNDCVDNMTNACPSDYGSLQPRSRIPYISGYSNGSMEHSSVYLYSSASGGGIRNDFAWDAAIKDDPDLAQVDCSDLQPVAEHM